MRKVRFLLVLIGLLISGLNAPTASANCQGVMCGGYCGVEGFDFCVYVWGGNETIGCKRVDGAGCMSMGSLICCPRIPRE